MPITKKTVLEIIQFVEERKAEWQAKELEEFLMQYTKTEYGKEDTIKVIALIKEYNEWMVDDTHQDQQRYARHLLNKLRTNDGVKAWRFTWEALLEAILKVISRNEYHSHKITSPKKIYYNLVSLIQICKQEKQRIEKQHLSSF